MQSQIAFSHLTIVGGGMHLVCNPPINTEKEQGMNKKETQHAVVAVMTSNCCTWVEPRSVD